MKFNQCEAIVLHGHDGKGNRKGLIPPRRCLRRATHGDYCCNHVSQAKLQDLFRSCLTYNWEFRVEQWERDQERAAKELERRRELAQQQAKLEAIRNPPRQGMQFFEAEAFIDGLGRAAEQAGHTQLARSMTEERLAWALAATGCRAAS